MNKERELLKRFMTELKTEEDVDSLFNDIKECLAQPDVNTQYLLDQVSRLTSENAMLKEKWLSQPEQTEHWKETLIEHFQSAFDSEMYRTDEGEELILLEDAICYVEAFAPPKREPLKIMLVLKLMNKYKDSRIDLIRAVEKKHGIGVDDEN